MKDRFISKIADFIRQESRLSFTGHKRTILARRLDTRLADLQLADYEAYWQFLRQNKSELETLLDLVTTNETSFFRNPAQFAFLYDRIIPGLEQLPLVEKSGISVLSAGCSTGEEPYSIAMTLLEAVRYPQLWQLKIVAGDLSAICLEQARYGFYEDDKLGKIPEPYRKKYLEYAEGGAFVSKTLKEMISFERLNIGELMNAPLAKAEDSQGKFDVIFCRNVMIYFSAACQQALIDTLYDLLLPGGYLFTGDAEPLHLFTHKFQPVDTADCLVYRKPANNGSNYAG